MIEACVCSVQSNLQNIVVDNENNHSDKKISKTCDNASRSLANGFFATEVLCPKSEQHLTDKGVKKIVSCDPLFRIIAN